MSDNVAGMIVFVIIAGGIVVLIALGRFLFFLLNKGSYEHGDEIVISEEDEFLSRNFRKNSEEFSKATMGDPHYTTSIHFVE